MSKIRIILFVIFTGILTMTTLLFIGFQTMEIEDHYGDLQEVFYQSETGDIIVNKTTNQYGVIEKSWKRINVRTTQKDSTDLYHWVFSGEKILDIETYRPNKPIDKLEKINLTEVTKNLKLITSYKEQGR